MAKSMYKNPGGESSLTGSKGLVHHEPVSRQFVREQADHARNTERTHSDEDGWQNEPQTFGDHQQDEPGERD
jgi:hypothetical protein